MIGSLLKVLFIYNVLLLEQLRVSVNVIPFVNGAREAVCGLEFALVLPIVVVLSVILSFLRAISSDPS
jgi:hypothetical protein